jgi:DNA polymerase family A
MNQLTRFRSVWVGDTEFGGAPGDIPAPRCAVFHEVHSSETVRMWEDELHAPAAPSWLTEPDNLFVAFFASAELGTFLALGWPLPRQVLDLYAEFRCLTNGKAFALGNSLVSALVHFELPALNAVEKQAMRRLALRGGPWAEQERRDLLDYCEGDVRATTCLLKRMLPSIDLDRALQRGRYMRASASMEHVGVPVDRDSYVRVRSNLPELRTRAVQAVAGPDSPFVGDTLRSRDFAHWLDKRHISWPVDQRNRALFDAETFAAMSKRDARVRPIAKGRALLGQLNVGDLTIGKDSRNRALLSPFRARSGRNQPSNSRFIMGCPSWMRVLVRPTQGQALGYLDFSQQELGIAAALSGDVAMQDAYRSGDAYLAFARQARAVPADATKRTHADVREVYKRCSLGVLFGMGAETLARRTGKSVYEAERLLVAHRRAYPTFWKWSDGVADVGRLHRLLHTVLGWQWIVGPDAREAQLRNFPMQAHGAEILRAACAFALEAGVRICAPLHDAALIDAKEEDICRAVAVMRQAMVDASIAVIGMPLRVDAEIVRFPSSLGGDSPIWRLLNRLLGEIGQ